MNEPIRVMLERGKKKRVVASAFDWPGWDRSTKLGDDALAVLDSYRPRFAKVAELAGYGDEFARLGDFEVVEQVEGIGMTDYYGVSGRAATVEHDPMTDADFERKLALLQAAWSTFDDTASRVSIELRKGPRGGGREKERIIRAREWCGDRRVRSESRCEGAFGDQGGSPGPGDLSGCLRRSDPRASHRGESARSWALPVPDPTLCLAHARPRVGT